MYRGAVYYLHNKTACTHKVLHLIDNRFIIKKKKGISRLSKITALYLILLLFLFIILIQF